MKFRIKPGDESLTRMDFVECPAWSEHYDFEEINTIASWGVDRNWLAEQFRKLDTGGPHPNYTILDLDRLPHHHMRIFLKAEFRHGGAVIDGFIMNADACCIGLFIEDDVIIFSRNSNIRSMMLPEKAAVEQRLGIPDLFPLQYKTSFLDSKGAVIAGEFSFTD